ncbi:hypothetical protein C8F04DRAFT_1249527 [Mycena alexandri]|uniref:Pyridoxamine 5'-phosphate oxidase Alr4036 family FMN-binding domain-containing protein n=1 Tax=Mycena alexandri TaxID=1745969 RepID=A0AAD6XE83_9AGAR|nr:hypothetical protein C8F04DRAFT_1249527 [Mycena alexandri]
MARVIAATSSDLITQKLSNSHRLTRLRWVLRPHVRSLGCRGFISRTDDPSHALLLYTPDVRTPKTAQMIANPHVQLDTSFTSTVPPVSVLNGGQNTSGRQSGSKYSKMRARSCKGVTVGRPGSRCDSGQAEFENLSLELDEPRPDDTEKRLWEMSLSNLALVVIEPQEVDYVELTPMLNRHTRFWRASGGKEQALVL